MNLTIRAKLFLTSVLLLLVGGVVSGTVLSSVMRDQAEARLVSQLHQDVRVMGELLSSPVAGWGAAGSAETGEALDALADRLGAATGVRVSIIGADGSLVGDSWLVASALPGIESHAERPEILLAAREGEGMAERHSATLDQSMLYVAAALGPRAPAAFVRVAAPFTELSASRAELLKLMGIAGVAGLVVALFMSGLASYHHSQALQELVEDARAIARGSKRQGVAVTSAGELGGLAGSLNQIHDEMEEVINTLAKERDRFQAVLDGMGEAVIALDPQQRITLCNARAMSLLDLKAPPLGKTLLEVVRVPDLQELAQATRAGEGRQIEFNLVSPSERRRVLARGTPQRTGGGTVLVMLDVTELRRLERMRRDFVANVSHELRTPVQIIQANAETLLDGAMEDPEAGPFFLKALLRNANRLNHLIADLLDISRLEAGMQTLSGAPVNLGELSARVLEDLIQPAEARGITVRSEIGLDVVALGEEKALEQVLHNLVENAIKYIDEGGRVQLRSIREGESVRVEIEDNGLGIPPQHRSRLFERFYRVDPGRSREMGGTGLGLAIVKHLVGAMGGEVGMRPARPRGSVFWFTLPKAGEGGEGEG